MRLCFRHRTQEYNLELFIKPERLYFGTNTANFFWVVRNIHNLGRSANRFTYQTRRYTRTIFPRELNMPVLSRFSASQAIKIYCYNVKIHFSLFLVNSGFTNFEIVVSSSIYKTKLYTASLLHY